jgi:hypothetical protein
MLTRPRWLLHAEGAAIFAAALYFYAQGHWHWWLFAILFLSPDLFMLGFLVNVKLGTALYNLVHTEVGPIVLLLFAWIFPAPQLVPYALIWLSHQGLDRMLGFGLKYPTHFRDSHLQHV